MSGKLQRQRHHQRPTAAVKRRQAMLVRAVVGSLVLCAALTPNALSQSGGANNARQQNVAPHDGRLRSIDPQPFRKLLGQTRQMLAAGEINSETTFSLSISADVTNDGELRDVNVFVIEGTDHRWSELGTAFATALSDSKLLKLLDKETGKVELNLALDKVHASLAFWVYAISEARAAQLAKSYTALLNIGRRARGEGVEVLNNMAFSANGKQLTMRLEMSREMVGNLFRQHTSLP